MENRQADERSGAESKRGEKSVVRGRGQRSFKVRAGF